MTFRETDDDIARVKPRCRVRVFIRQKEVLGEVVEMVDGGHAIVDWHPGDTVFVNLSSVWPIDRLEIVR